MVRRLFAHLFKGDMIKEQAKEEGEILRGARAMNKQLRYGFLERQTRDYDLFSKKPKKAAYMLERKLDKVAKADQYYVKPAKHKGTWKVMDRGQNLQSEEDDFGVVDYTEQPKRVRTVNFNGVPMVHQSVRIMDAKRTLKNPEAEFRWEKEKDDLERIRASRLLK